MSNTIQYRSITKDDLSEIPNSYILGDVLVNTLAVNSITRSESIVTVTTVENHLYANEDLVTINGSDQLDYNGNFFIINVTGDKTFTYDVVGTPDTPATGTIGVINKTEIIDYTGNLVNFNAPLNLETNLAFEPISYFAPAGGDLLNTATVAYGILHEADE